MTAERGNQFAINKILYTVFTQDAVILKVGIWQVIAPLALATTLCRARCLIQAYPFIFDWETQA